PILAGLYAFAFPLGALYPPVVLPPGPGEREAGARPAPGRRPRPGARPPRRPARARGAPGGGRERWEVGGSRPGRPTVALAPPTGSGAGDGFHRGTRSASPSLPIGLNARAAPSATSPAAGLSMGSMPCVTS